MAEYQFLIALGFLMAAATTVVTVAAFRFRDFLQKNLPAETIKTSDAMSMPIVGSVVLFSLYVLLRFIPKEYFNLMLSCYLSIIGVFALGSFLERYKKPNLLTGAFCVTVGAYYWWTKSWVANDVLAFAIGVTALEVVPLHDFATAYLLLIGLFFYDIFWVFGSDVMLTVATGVDGPIKLLFPRTIFGSHQSMSLLGLGDLIVPGFFICQTLVFSRDVVKCGNFYFIVAITAYILSLANTMVVMVMFRHGQPALLFIVPWLLITFTLAVIYKGDVNAAWDYHALSVMEAKEPTEAATPAEEPKQAPAEEGRDETLAGTVISAVAHLFGLDKDAEKPQISGAKTLVADLPASKKNE